MAYLNRDPAMCRFEPDPHRGRNDLVAGQEAALRLLARQGRRAPHCFERDLSYARPPPESWRLADARQTCDAVASELEREIAAETIRLAARRALRRVAPASAASVPRTVTVDGEKQIWGVWDWEGPARDAAKEAGDAARHEALRNDWIEHREQNVRDDAEYTEAVTERSNLFDALGFPDLEAARAAASTALMRDMYKQNDAMVEGRRRARVRRNWAAAKSATRAIGAQAAAAARVDAAASPAVVDAPAVDVGVLSPSSPAEEEENGALADGLNGNG
jgi:hypothetical protein